MMEAERASETLDCSSILTRLVTREDFIALVGHVILKVSTKEKVLLEAQISGEASEFSKIGNDLP
jgi:hypothetical protein